MVFSKNVDASSSTDHSEALMHNFRYHYDGLVLYLGVNTGKDANGQDVGSVAIDFDKIAKFREDSDRNKCFWKYSNRHIHERR